ncbi:MAG TPA: hypothetical protein VMJ73_08900 [Rhizomicrobium sp.]|nr:hypothetical protein [Rhizomicrobium sp.]
MTPARAFRIAVTLAVAAALSGCVFFETRQMRAMRNDPNFKLGYSDGCASASARGTSFTGSRVRDDSLFETSQPYRAGWSNGYRTCNNELNPSNNEAVGDMPDHRPNP